MIYMTDNIFIDTSILVYLFDKSEIEKHTKIKSFLFKLIETKVIIISTQIINEFINNDYNMYLFL